jgi:hypothetical protein
MRPNEKITSRAAGMRVTTSSVRESPTQRRAMAGERQTVPMYQGGGKRRGLAVLLTVRTIKAHIQAGAGQQQTKDNGRQTCIQTSGLQN